MTVKDAYEKCIELLDRPTVAQLEWVAATAAWLAGETRAFAARLAGSGREHIPTAAADDLVRVVEVLGDDPSPAEVAHARRLVERAYVSLTPRVVARALETAS